MDTTVTVTKSGPDLVKIPIEQGMKLVNALGDIYGVAKQTMDGTYYWCFINLKTMKRGYKIRCATGNHLGQLPSEWPSDWKEPLVVTVDITACPKQFPITT